MRILSVFMLVLATATALEHYIAEVLFMVDPQVITRYQQWGYTETEAKTQAEGDIKFFIFEANKYYESLVNYNLYLEIRPTKIEWLTEDIYASDVTSDGKLDTGTSLTTFIKYLDDNKMYDTYKYDIAFIFTGYNLADPGNDGVAGYAYVQDACETSGHGVGALEMGGTQMTATLLAHELGHSLGSEHDESGNNCPISDGYIMAPTAYAANKNRWSFSSCSEKYIVDYIKTLNNEDRNCLTETTADPFNFDLNQEMGRDIIDREKVCTRMENTENSNHCNSEYFYKGEVKGDRVCQSLWCGERSVSYCDEGMPTEGMVCDVGKRCQKGKCITAPDNFKTPSNLDPDCLWHDDKTNALYTNFAGGCADYVNQYGTYECETNSVFLHRCCESCANALAKQS